MDKQLGIVVKTPTRYPDEGKRHALESARRQLGNQLFEFLWANKLPVVIDIEEVITNGHPEDPYGEDVIEYRVTATAVRHRHVEVPVFTHADFKPIKNHGILGRVANWLAKLELKF